MKLIKSIKKQCEEKPYKKLLLFGALCFVVFLILFSFTGVPFTGEDEATENITEVEESNESLVEIVTTNESETFLDENGSVLMECEYLNGSAHQNCSIEQ